MALTMYTLNDLHFLHPQVGNRELINVYYKLTYRSVYVTYYKLFVADLTVRAYW